MKGLNFYKMAKQILNLDHKRLILITEYVNWAN